MKMIEKAPKVGIVCGSGLSTLSDALQNRIDLTFVLYLLFKIVIFAKMFFSMIVRTVFLCSFIDV